MRHLLWMMAVAIYVTATVGFALLIFLVSFSEWLRERWVAYLARQLSSTLEAERRRHADDLAEARRQHKDAQAWLMETHRQEIARIEARQQQRVNEAVIEAMTSCARDPRAA